MLKTEKKNAKREQIIEEKISLNKIRMNAVIKKLKEHEVSRIIDLGCGEGKLLKLLLKDTSCKKIVGVDVSTHELKYC